MITKITCLFLAAGLILTSAQAHARSYGHISSTQSQKNVEEIAILTDGRGKALCGVGFATDQLRACNQTEMSITAELQNNSYNHAPQVAALPMIALGYYLACTTLNAGTYAVSTAIGDFYEISTYLAITGTFFGAMASWTVCLPATAINYGIVYLVIEAKDAVKSFRK